MKSDGKVLELNEEEFFFLVFSIKELDNISAHFVMLFGGVNEKPLNTKHSVRGIDGFLYTFKKK